MCWAVAAIVAGAGRSRRASHSGPAAPATQAPPAAGGPVRPASSATTPASRATKRKDKQLGATLHGKAQNPRTPAANANQACETCHGPGKEHSETGDKAKIRVFTTMTPRDVSEVCVGCHNRSTHALWKGSMHDARNLSCITCHTSTARSRSTRS